MTRLLRMWPLLTGIGNWRSPRGYALVTGMRAAHPVRLRSRSRVLAHAASLP